MMVLTKTYPGFIHICSNCGALLQFNAADIYENKWIYCPICRSKEDCQLDKSYNGVTFDYGNKNSKIISE